MDRRDTLAVLTTSMIVAPLSGCLDFAGLRPDSDNEQNQEQNADDSEESRTDNADNSKTAQDNKADEEPAADEDERNDNDELPDPNDVKQRDAGEDVLEFGDLQIIDYEERVKEFEYDEEISYTGKVENGSDKVYESVSVEVRVYDEDGNELGSHRDLTPEIAAGEIWRFEITPHNRPEEITDHDIAVVAGQ